MRRISWVWKKLRAPFSQIRSVLLLSYFVIILLCITLVGTVSFYISYKSTVERIETASFQIVRQIENNIDNDFQNKRNLLLAPYTNKEYIDSINDYLKMGNQEKFLFRQKLGDLFLKSFNTTPIRDFIRFQIYYSNGELLNSSDNSSQLTASQVQNSEWFRQTIAKSGIVNFINPSSSSKQQEGAEAYSTAILIRDFANPKEFIVVRADYSAGLFNGIGQHADLTPHSQILILDESNNPVYMSTVGQGESPSSEMLARLIGENGKFWSKNNSDAIFVSYSSSSYTNWKTVLVMPKKEIFSPLNQIKTTAVLTALVAFLLAFFISVLFGRSITNPILNLYKSVNQIKRGDFSSRLDTNRSDEIGRIAMNFNAMQEELQKLIETKYIYQIKLQQSELAMLYSQINPHFLYNTLDSIKAMADYHQVEEVGDMAQSLADMFRYNTKNRNEIATLQEELVQIEAYMKIQGIRFENKIVFELDIDEELYKLPILKMTLQPLVENSVFHGIERKRGTGTIRVIAQKEDNLVYLTVSDDGIGISESKLETIRTTLRQPLYQEEFVLSAADGGIGIQNVYARYAIRFAEHFEFRIVSQMGLGTRVTLILDANYLEQNPK